MPKAKSAVIYELPARYVVEVDGVVVDFGRSAYTAAEIAKAHGATKMEVEKWDKEKHSISSEQASSD